MGDITVIPEMLKVQHPWDMLLRPGAILDEDAGALPAGGVTVTPTYHNLAAVAA
jgi:hypothetical protein